MKGMPSLTPRPLKCPSVCWGEWRGDGDDAIAPRPESCAIVKASGLFALGGLG